MVDIFQTIERFSRCAQAFYDIPPMRSRRAAAFGYGTKYDFTKQTTKTPGPNTYSQDSILEIEKKRGFSFGLGREVSHLLSKISFIGYGSYRRTVCWR
jgi:hypothetical protein